MHRMAIVIILLMTLSPARMAATAEADEAAVSRYEMDVALDTGTSTIGGTLQLDWVNVTGETQAKLPFRLYPNGDHYGEGSITVSTVTVDGNAVTPVRERDPTVLTVPLGATVEPGESRSLAMTFETVIPADASGGFGILQHLSGRDWWALADWYPVVAGWEGDDGWYLDPPTTFGDPTFVSFTARYDVTVRHPAGLTLIGAGTEETRATGRGDITTTSFSESRLREFAMVALPADDIAETSFVVAGQPVTITLPHVWQVPGLATFIETRARAAIPLYQAWFGIQSDEELDLTVAVLTGALGVSWDQILWLDLESIAEDGVLGEAEKIGLEPVIYHEIGHQWLAADIGVNSNDHTFLTEGLVNTLVVAIVRETDGPDKARRVMGGFVAGPYRAFVNGNQDGIVDQPISDDRSGVVHSFLVYGKAGVGFEAIRQEIGDEAFFEAIGQLGEIYEDGWFTPDQLLRLFEETSGQELDQLWSFWFERAVTDLDDVDAVVAASGR